MKLSKHFSREEFESSNVASGLGIVNRMSGDDIARAQALCVVVLEQLRSYAQEPVLITSGYRCKELNKLVGGANSSQHMLGEAADIQPSRVAPDGHTRSWDEFCALLRDWFTFLQDNCIFDQLIFEIRPLNRWIHVSYKTDIRSNRQQTLKIVK